LSALAFCGVTHWCAESFRDPSISDRKTLYRSCDIKSALSRVLDETRQALEQRLRRISLAQLMAELEQENFSRNCYSERNNFIDRNRQSQKKNTA
jgi:DNA-binding IscR family transcriptional regulator